MPTISVVIPAYNAEATLVRAIDSVLAQTVSGPDVEVLVCNDGSTDGTAAILDGYDDRVIAIHQPNRGRGAARNACLAKARGAFIALLDADDWWVPRRLETGLSSAERHPDCGVFYANALIVDSGGTIHGAMNGEWHIGHGGWVFPLLIRNNFVPAPTLLVRQEVVEAAGPFDEALRRTQDLEWLLRLSLQSRFHYDHVPLVYCDNHTWGTAEKQQGTYECYLRVLEQTAHAHPELAERHAWMFRKSLCDCHTALAAFWEDQGEYARAAECYAAALAAAPSVRVLRWKYCLARYRAGDSAVSERALRDLLADEEYHGDAHFYLGNVLIQGGRAAEAVEQYELALTSAYLYQKFPECVNNLAVALVRAGETRRVRALLEQALDQHAFYSDAIKNLHALERGAPAGDFKWTPRKVF